MQLRFVISEASAAYWRAWKAARAATAMAMTEVVTVAALALLTVKVVGAVVGAAVVGRPGPLNTFPTRCYYSKTSPQY